MMRGNRKMLVAATLVAIPFAFLVANLSTGQTPIDESTTVQHAVATSTADPGETEVGAIRQVVGKQFESRPSSGSGLLQAFGFGSKKETQPRSVASSQTNHQHEQNQTGGFLSGLFKRSSGSSKTTQSAMVPLRGSNDTTQSREPTDWSGIPYHTAKSVRKSNAIPTPAPIRDPGVSTRNTRIIRGRAPEPLRSNSTQSISRIPTPPPAIPQPTATARTTTTRSTQPRTVQPRTDTPQTITRRSTVAGLSSETSSRRSGRRSLDVLDPNEPSEPQESIASSRQKTTPAKALAALDLVPKVARRIITTDDQSNEESKSDSTNVAVTKPAKPAAESVASSQTTTGGSGSTSASGAGTAEGAGAASAAESIAAKATAIPKPAAINAAVPSAELAMPTAAAKAPAPIAAAPIATAPIATAPIATAPKVSVPSATLQAPSYQTPSMDTTSVAATTPPSLPRNTSKNISTTPSKAVSHRAGPPPAAFGPGEFVAATRPAIVDSQSTSPVGSGLAAPLNNNATTQPFSEQYVAQPSNTQTARNQAYGNQAYGNQASVNPTPARGGTQNAFDLANGKMTTNGQPVEVQEDSAAAPSRAMVGSGNGQTAAGVPLHDSHRGAADDFQQPGDDGSRTNTAYANDMRNGINGRELMPGQNSVASELPGIRVVTFGPGEIMIRQTRQYEIRVENRGAINAEGILVRAIVPDWAEIQGHKVSQGSIENEAQGRGECMVWSIPSLPAGSVERMFVQLRAERSGTHDLDVDWTLLPQHAIATVKVHEPRLDLTIDGPEEVIYGESQTYTVRVLNPGDGTAPNVVFTLSPNSATPQTQRIGDIPAGKEAQFEVELTAQDLVDLKIHGLASGDLDLRAEAEKTISVSAAKLEAMLTGPEIRYQNTESLYNLEVQNNGTATSEDITATLRMPSGVKYLGGIEEASPETGVLAWTVKALAPGASRNYQFRCNMTATGEQRFAFECKGTAAGQTSVALATRVESIADLVLTINDPAAPAPIGADVTYEIVVRNRGSKEATDVRAIAQFSHGIEPSRIEGQSGELLTGQVVFDPIAKIAAGQEVRMRVVAKADRAGHHRFRTEVRSGDTVLVAEEATHYMSPQSDRVSRHSSDSQTR
ncbi:Large cysteine-rich periplasmic protein OmcB [Planctomycetes bacterium CA13]|uniref:Large cysteine-rich periplasmic protein OmcB n=1 Tax=Novipirellula herctigrandis TaxID=2527986 RepID=A0A5C5YNV7_9BACT|nr:Large cysteine-rich periplasmic protein OmcB [Planctomycetes bacterium CA13]